MSEVKKEDRQSVRVNVLLFLLIGMFLACWIGNLQQLRHCDGKAPWIGEVVHGVGLLAPSYLFTAWRSWDRGKVK